MQIVVLLRCVHPKIHLFKFQFVACLVDGRVYGFDFLVIAHIWLLLSLQRKGRHQHEACLVFM